jgi:hypothetical protein
MSAAPTPNRIENDEMNFPATSHPMSPPRMRSSVLAVTSLEPEQLLDELGPRHELHVHEQDAEQRRPTEHIERRLPFGRCDGDRAHAAGSTGSGSTMSSGRRHASR